MNTNKIRQDFPLFQAKLKGKPIVYLDNACQTLRPQSVIDAMNDYYVNYPACAGRSVHKLAEMVTNKCAQARKDVAGFIGAKNPKEIVFTRNTTEGINLVANSLDFKAGDVVLTTDKEHNSNLIPWQVLAKKKGIVLKYVPSKADNTFDLEKFNEMMSEKVKLVSMVYTSNLDGVTLPAAEIIKTAHKFGAKVLLDAAQTAPHQKIDVSKLDVDFLALSGHKMLGPSGIGVFYGKYKLLESLEPFLVGGETVEYSTYEDHKMLPPPDKFEAGLQDYAGILGLGAAVKYLQDVGMENVAKHEHELGKFITEEMLKMPKVKIIGPQDSALRGGIVSFYIDGVDAHQIALLLDETANIMIRSGRHCVHSWFDKHNIINSARASLYFYNTMEEAQLFVDTLNKIIKIL